MAEYLYPVTEEYVKKDGKLYPITHRFIKKGDSLYPITHKFVASNTAPAVVDTDFRITVNSGSDSSFILPTTGWRGSTYNSYAWVVDWGDGSTSEHIGTGAAASGITHNYPSANTNYTIKIKPQNPNERGWLWAFGFSTTTDGSSAPENKNKVLVVDGQITDQAYYEGTYARSRSFAYMFYGCTNLTMGNAFQLPQGITRAGNFFCESMFSGCTSLTMNDVFQLPQGIVNVSNFFCRNMFRGCTSLTMNDVFQLPQGIANVGGDDFCRSMFYGCNSLTSQASQILGSLVLNDNNLNRSGVYLYMFSYCSSLNEPLINIPQLQSIPNSRKYTFQGCPADIIAPLHANWK